MCKDGWIEDDQYGIVVELVWCVFEKMFVDGVQCVDMFVWGIEVDFVEELGFKWQGGLVVLVLVFNELIVVVQLVVVKVSC